MHDAAMRYVIRALDDAKFKPGGKSVVEFGSRDVNGGVRPLFAGCDAYTGVDARAGRGVDVVGDAATWGDDGCCDVVVTTETLEHAPHAGRVIANARRLLRPGGRFIMTAAGRGRAPHGVDGGALGGEFYRNIERADLERWLADAFGAGQFAVEEDAGAGDIYAGARVPTGGGS